MIVSGVLQITDGAAAVLMMTRREALRRGLPIVGIFRSFAAVGVDPAIMGVGPAVAIPAAVEKVSAKQSALPGVGVGEQLKQDNGFGSSLLLLTVPSMVLLVFIKHKREWLMVG